MESKNLISDAEKRVLNFVPARHYAESASVATFESEISNERVYLYVPYAHKDVCKQLGGQWDNHRKQWYVNPMTPLFPFKIWMERPAKPVFVPHVSHVSLFNYLVSFLMEKGKAIEVNNEKMQILVKTKDFLSPSGVHSGYAVLVLKNSNSNGIPQFRVAMAECFQSEHPLVGIPLSLDYAGNITILSIDNLESTEFQCSPKLLV